MFKRYSNWLQLQKVFAWVLRYKSKLLAKIKKRRLGNVGDVKVTPLIAPLSVEELECARRAILMHVQRQHFGEELHRLQRGENNSVLQKSNNLLKLDPQFKDGLLCVGGRLQQAPISNSARHPTILPKSDHTVDLIIRHYHEVCGHSGLEYTLSLIRQHYWIINPRTAVRQVLNNCVSCRKRQAHAAKQKMALITERCVALCCLSSEFSLGSNMIRLSIKEEKQFLSPWRESNLTSSVTSPTC